MHEDRKERQCLRREGSGSTQGKGSVALRLLRRLLRQPRLPHKRILRDLRVQQAFSNKCSRTPTGTAAADLNAVGGKYWRWLAANIGVGWRYNGVGWR